MNLFDRVVSLAIPIVPKPIVRYFSRPYIAGTRIRDAFRVVQGLGREGAMATLDILGELTSRREEAERNTGEYARLVGRIASDKIPSTNVSVKLTALGLLLDPQLCLDNMRRLMAAAEETDNFIRIDMEDSSCTAGTLEIYRALREEFPGRVGAVLQARLRRSMQDVDGLTDQPTNLRICKGIYIEPREIAYTDPEDIRRNFTGLLDRMLVRGAYVGIATHDEVLIREALDLIRKYSLTHEQYEFQMLLGVTEQLRRSLLEAGHRLRVYVPYGEQWYPYSVRRLKENPQIAGHVFRAMLNRRRASKGAH